jgi:hypothetical protein
LIAKLGVVLEEADETVFWPELIAEATLFASENCGVAEGSKRARIYLGKLAPNRRGR